MSTTPAELPHGIGRPTWRPGVGLWMLSIDGELTDTPRWTAIAYCPSCKEPLNLCNHKIDVNGQVTPSAGHRRNVCDWHPESIRLNGWADATRIPPPVLPWFTCERCAAKSRRLGGWGTWGGGPGIICDACIKQLRTA